MDVQCIMQALCPTWPATSTPRSSRRRPRSDSGRHPHPLRRAQRPGSRQRRSCAAPSTTTMNRQATTIPDVVSDVVPGFARVHQLHARRQLSRLAATAQRRHHVRGASAAWWPTLAATTRVQQDGAHNSVVAQLLANDVPSSSRPAAARGLRQVRATVRRGGHGVGRPRIARGPARPLGIPPVLHMGSCVDNTRILTVLSQMAHRGRARRGHQRYPLLWPWRPNG